MDLETVMSQQSFAIVGDTRNPEKYACKIRNAMVAAGYTVYAVGKELPSLNDLPEPVDIIDLCIHPAKGLKLLMENQKTCRCVVIQPGAESPEILDYLHQAGIPFLQSCLLKGLSQYR